MSIAQKGQRWSADPQKLGAGEEDSLTGFRGSCHVDVCLELSCLFNDSADVGNLISGSSAFSSSGLNILKFMVHVLLKPCLDNFEHYFASV